MGQKEAIGGLTYLTSLTDQMPVLAKPEAWAAIVREKSSARQLAYAGQWLTDTVLMGQSRPEDMLPEMEDKLAAIALRGGPIGGLLTMGKVIEMIPGGFGRILGEGGIGVGTPTGFINLDGLTGGFHAGELVILAARPGMGKTAMALNFAYNVARAGDTAAIFSLEMSKTEIFKRLVCSAGSFDTELLRTGKLTKEQRARATAIGEELLDLPILLDDSATLNPADVLSRVRRVAATKKPKLVIVDYLGLLNATQSGIGDNRARELGLITKGLKNIARELDTCVLVLSQLNRKCEERTNKRPILSDLKESGSIEEDADMVLMLYRDSYYKNKERDDADGLRLGEVLVRKQRNGPLGRVLLAYADRYVRFNNLAPSSAIEDTYDWGDE